MAFGNLGDRGGAAMAEINIIPLCDVLLVLLIIFMVTAPALSHRIGLDLPQAGRTEPRPEPPEPVELRVASSGQLFWNGDEASRVELQALMLAEARRDPGNQPLLRVDAAGDADYQTVAQVLADAQNAGLQRIGFASR